MPSLSRLDGREYLAKWTDTEECCALADGERHLAHVIRLNGRWLAFDATRLNAPGNGLLCLGILATAAEAKNLAERAIRRGHRQAKTRAAPTDMARAGTPLIMPPSAPNGDEPGLAIALAIALEIAALEIESFSARHEWRGALRCVWHLLETVERVGFCAPGPARCICWSSLSGGSAEAL